MGDGVKGCSYNCTPFPHLWALNFTFYLHQIKQTNTAFLYVRVQFSVLLYFVSVFLYSSVLLYCFFVIYFSVFFFLLYMCIWLNESYFNTATGCKHSRS
jgi:hypothetical protein